jgi:hypothetical protein
MRQGVRRNTVIDLETLLEAFLEDLGLFSSTAKASGFPEYQHLDQRNSTVQYYGYIHLFL